MTQATNDTMIRIESAYPIFEANQVLSFRHLNQLARYLEQQDRLTRAKTIGIGILCGLTVTNKGNHSLEIAGGVGLTSAGYLASFESPATYAWYAPYTDPSEYAPFHPGAGAVPLWQLFTDQPPSHRMGQRLANTPGFLDDKAVILFLETSQVDLDTCLADNCINQGMEQRHLWRVLLIEKQVLTDIIHPNLEADRDARFQPQEVYVKRDCFPPEVSTRWRALRNRYRIICVDAAFRLHTAVKDGFQAYQNLIGLTDNPFTGLVNRLLSDLGGILGQQYMGIQHFYEHVKGLAYAYNSFLRHAFALSGRCCPDSDLFPRHLMLDAAQPVTECRPALYRHHFTPSPIHEPDPEGRAHVVWLFQRFKRLVENFEAPGLKAMRITPGAWPMPPLENGPIPIFYNDAKVRNFWDYDAWTRCRSDHILSYHAADASQLDHVRNPLSYSLDAYNFLRIEGHVGRSKDEVVKFLEKAKKERCLSYDIVALRFGPIAEEGAEKACQFEDLRTLYRASRDEMLCLSEDFGAYLSSLDKDNDPLPLEENPYINIVDDFVEIQWQGFRPFPITVSGEGQPAPILADRAGRTSQVRGFQVVPERAATAPPISAESMFSVRQGNVTHLFLTIDEPYFPLFLPEVVANLLIQNLLGLLLKLRPLLPLELSAFQFDDFNQAHARVMDKARQLKTFLENHFDGIENSDLVRDLLGRLANLLDDCLIARLESLARDYRDRHQADEQSRTLANFIQDHPGLEHKGGVAFGGTFVIVYDDFSDPPVLDGEFETFNTLLDQELRKLEPTPPTSQRDVMWRMAEGSAFLQGAEDFIKQGLETDNEPQQDACTSKDLGAAARIAFNQTRGKLLLGAETVVADFCLPYLCCSGCHQTTYIFLPEPSLALPTDQFCEDQQGPFRFNAQPPGGVLEGSGVKPEENGGTGFNFFPDEAGVGIHQFIYTVQGRTATLTVEVFQKPSAEFEYQLATSDSLLPNSVQFFTTEDLPTAVYLWDFGDDNASGVQNPTHNYQNSGTYQVSLIVTNGPCIAEWGPVPITIAPPTRDTLHVKIANLDLEVSDFSGSPGLAQVPILLSDPEKPGRELLNLDFTLEFSGSLSAITIPLEAPMVAAHSFVGAESLAGIQNPPVALINNVAGRPDYPPQFIFNQSTQGQGAAIDFVGQIWSDSAAWTINENDADKGWKRGLLSDASGQSATVAKTSLEDQLIAVLQIPIKPVAGDEIVIRGVAKEVPPVRNTFEWRDGVHVRSGDLAIKSGVIRILESSAPFATEAYVVDNLSDASGTDIGIDYLPPQTGGLGGDITLVITSFPAAATQFRIKGSDGFEIITPTKDSQEKLTISTSGDGSPSREQEEIAYAIQPMDGPQHLGLPAQVKVHWNPPLAEVSFLPPFVRPGLSVAADVWIKNFSLIEEFQDYGYLTSDAPGWSQGKVRLTQSKLTEVSGSTLTFKKIIAPMEGNEKTFGNYSVWTRMGTSKEFVEITSKHLGYQARDEGLDSDEALLTPSGTVSPRPESVLKTEERVFSDGAPRLDTLREDPLFDALFTPNTRFWRSLSVFAHALENASHEEQQRLRYLDGSQDGEIARRSRIVLVAGFNKMRRELNAGRIEHFNYLWSFYELHLDQLLSLMAYRHADIESDQELEALLALAEDQLVQLRPLDRLPHLLELIEATVARVADKPVLHARLKSWNKLPA